MYYNSNSISLVVTLSNVNKENVVFLLNENSMVLVKKLALARGVIHESDIFFNFWWL